jgi:NAD-dependent SIR2 family protein deacetylase
MGLKKQNKEIKKEISESRCLVCGNKLDFTYFTDFQSNKIKESPVCKECGIVFIEENHTLN